MAVSLGPEHGTVGPDQIKEAAKEAMRGPGVDLLVVLGFAFDPARPARRPESSLATGDGFATAEDERRYGKLRVLLARMNPDLAMGGGLLKKTGSGNLFMVFGEPDLDLRRDGDEVTVDLKGVDVYDPTTGQVRSGSTDDVACWLVDTNYNGESFFVRHALLHRRQRPLRPAPPGPAGRHRRGRLVDPLRHHQPPVPHTRPPARSPSRSSITTATRSCRSTRSVDAPAPPVRPLRKCDLSSPSSGMVTP